MDEGQSLFEVIVALAVITLIVVTVVAVAGTSIRNVSFARNNEYATRFSQEALEWVRSGSVSLSSSDLELIRDGSNNQEVGMRFRSLNISQGATILNAYVEFETDETSSETTNLTFYAEDTNDASTFTTSSENITSRTKTSASVAWGNVPAWNTVSQKHQTPNLSSIIQEVVNRAGWSSGNDLVVIVTGSGRRVAESYNGESSNAPLLYVEYQ